MYNWINKASSAYLNDGKSGYLLPGETPEIRFELIANTIQEVLPKNPTFKEEFLKYLDIGMYALSTPFITSVGRKSALPFSCSNQHIGDSMGEIAFAKGESAIMTKVGKGCSGYMDLRGAGAAITNSGISSPGSLYFAEGFNQIIKEVNQGVRRGYMALYWDIDHDDILNVLDIQRDNNPLDKINYGVCIGQDFLDKAANGDEKAREVLLKVHESRFLTGLPYIFFKDNVNNAKPDVYKDNDFTIKSSNLCVAPNTQILTNKGYEIISDLENQDVKIWNGEEFSDTKVVKTGTNQKLIKVITNSGYELDCTLYHKFYIQNDYFTKPIEVRANELKKGDKLIKFELPLIQGEKVLKNAYENGFYSGDGCLTPQGQRIYLYGEKRNLQKNFDSIISNWAVQEKSDRIYGHTNILKDKFFVPDSSFTIESRLKWLSGYLDADGTVTNNNSSQSLQIASTEKEFLKEIQLMLQTLGVDSKVFFARERGNYLLPANDGSGELKLYPCHELNRILINGNSLFKLSQLGLKCDRLKWEIKKPNRECSHFIKIESVTELEELSDTYCFTEPLRNMGMFNGILTGNCTEILEVSDDKYSFVCDIAAMNAIFIDHPEFGRAVEVLAQALDGLHTIYQRTLLSWKHSDKKEDNYKWFFLQKAYKSSHDFRDIGVGCTGYHTLLQNNNVAFESMDAKYINAKLFKKIQEHTLKSSQELALLYGEPKMLEGYGRRNCLMNAVAPNTSSAFILEQVSQGIEPIFSNYYIKDIAGGKHVIKNPNLEKLLEELGINTRSVWNSIAQNDGSVSHLTELNEHQKNVFKTFQEIAPMEILIQAAQRQQFIDQSQSLNLMINQKVGYKEVNALLYKAAELGIKTLYYQHGTNAAQQLRKSLLECESCAG